MNGKKKKLSGMMIAGIIILVSFFYSINIKPVVIGGSDWSRTYAELNSFNSYDELAEFLDRYDYGFYGEDYNCLEEVPRVMIKQSTGARNGIIVDSTSEGITIDYSNTNIQVEGVDEPDVVKTDGTHLYILSNSNLYIIKVYPAEKTTVLSIINFEDDVDVCNFLINKDHLIVFSSSYRDVPINEKHRTEYQYYPYWWGISTTIIDIYDISDKENPNLVNDIEIDGSFFDARMIGNYIYVIATEYTSNIYNKEDNNISINIPEISINNYTRQIPANHIYYVNNSERIDTMTFVISIDIYGDKIDQKCFLLGSSQKMYVSHNNIYLACQEYNYYYSSSEGNHQYEQTTVIHKILINNGIISYIAKGEVPGYTLNQFSMDEHNGFFRIATQTTGLESKSTTNLFVLDKSLNLTSKIENIAPGETMHSARFMGDKAYLVTFKKVDPFFTVDLSNPYNAKIIGELKIPGYSDYLHPYDDNYIIGIGKYTVEPQEEYRWTRNFAWYQGLKIALFDVSDFENPKEVANVIIGDRGTDTPVLNDHKSFLFSRERELLVLPINLYKISDEIKAQNNGYTGNIHGRFAFQGAYVYKLSLENGFKFMGRITHIDNEEFLDDNYCYYSGSYSFFVSRSLYIDNILYTISGKMVKMNKLDDLSEINSVVLE